MVLRITLMMSLLILNLPLAKADGKAAPLSAKKILTACYGGDKSDSFTDECLAKVTTREVFPDFSLIQDSCRQNSYPTNLRCERRGLEFAVDHHPDPTPSSLTYRAGLVEGLISVFHDPKDSLIRYDDIAAKDLAESSKEFDKFLQCVTDACRSGICSDSAETDCISEDLNISTAIAERVYDEFEKERSWLTFSGRRVAPLGQWAMSIKYFTMRDNLQARARALEEKLNQAQANEVANSAAQTRQVDAAINAVSGAKAVR